MLSDEATDLANFIMLSKYLFSNIVHYLSLENDFAIARRMILLLLDE